MIRVAIADDHVFIREGLRRILKPEIDIEIVAEAENSAGVIEIVMKEKIDILILDVSLPGKSGIELLKDIQLLKPELKVIILSMHPESLYGLRALKAGAWGYLTKETSVEELIKAIRKITSGRKYLSESLAEHIATNIDKNTDDPLHSKLTDREYEVFIELALGKHLKEIADKLNISISTVNTYRQRIMEKMNMVNNFELTHYALKENLIEM